MSKKSRIPRQSGLAKKSRTAKPSQSPKIRRWLIFAAATVVLFAGLTYLFDFFPDEQRVVRGGIRSAAEKAFPDLAEEAAKSYGLTFLGGDASESAARSVLLIHGLDDPGLVWRDLTPVLLGEGFNVWQIRYPNDQPLLESARFLSEQVPALSRRGVDEISIVAHSMGGLISREMLTNPEMAYAERLRRGEVPRVAGLVMLATPNHGAELARFRLFGEFREQWVNMLEGRWQLLSGILDGAGEAKLDLLPESEFLTDLNARPHPEGVEMLSIAGDVSPWAGMDFDPAGDQVPGIPANAGQQMLADLGAILESMSEGSGDGLVPVRSTRLDGIPHRIVPGTHLTVIRNVLEGSSRIPPSVPLVTEFLDLIYSRE